MLSDQFMNMVAGVQFMNMIAGLQSPLMRQRGRLLLAFFYTWARIVMTFFYTWVLLVMTFFCTWVLLLSFFYTWDLLLLFLTHRPLAFIWPSFTHGLLLFIRPSLIHGPWTSSYFFCRQDATAEPAILWIHKYAWISSFHVSVVSHLRHYKYSAYGCTQTLSAPFSIPGISSIQHTDVPEHSQRHSLFSALQTFSISFGEELYLSRFTHPIFRLCYLDFGLLCRPHPSWHLILRLCHLDLRLLCRPHPSCLQYLMRGRVSPTKGSRIWFFGFVTWTLDYSADLILLAFSISYGGEFYLWLCYFDLGPRCRLYPSSLQYLMWRRVIKSCASGSSALLFAPYSADLILFALKISRGGDRLPATTHAFNHLILWLCSEELGVRCRPYSFCLQYLMWRRSSTIYSLYIRSLPILILFGEHFKLTVLFPHFSYKVLGVLTRLPKGQKIEAAKGSGGHPKQSTFCAQLNCRQLLHRWVLPLDPIFGHSRLLSISPPCQSSLHRRFLPLDPISGHSRLLSISHHSRTPCRAKQRTELFSDTDADGENWPSTISLWAKSSRDWGRALWMQAGKSDY